jgi:hypothetical protein
LIVFFFPPIFDQWPRWELETSDKYIA